MLRNSCAKPASSAWVEEIVVRNVLLAPRVVQEVGGFLMRERRVNGRGDAQIGDEHHIGLQRIRSGRRNWSARRRWRTPTLGGFLHRRGLRFFRACLISPRRLDRQKALDGKDPGAACLLLSLDGPNHTSGSNLPPIAMS